MKPRRIHQRRVRGWRLPPRAMSVARPSRYGNPWRVVPVEAGGLLGYTIAVPATALGRPVEPPSYLGLGEAHRTAVEYFRRFTAPTLDLAPLRGRDLACYCPPDLPCHVDVLLELANATRRSEASEVLVDLDRDEVEGGAHRVAVVGFLEVDLVGVRDSDSVGFDDELPKVTPRRTDEVESGRERLLDGHAPIVAEVRDARFLRGDGDVD